MYGAHIYYSYDTQTQVDKTCLVQKLTRHGKAQIMSEMIWAAWPVLHPTRADCAQFGLVSLSLRLLALLKNSNPTYATFTRVLVNFSFCNSNKAYSQWSRKISTVLFFQFGVITLWFRHWKTESSRISLKILSFAFWRWINVLRVWNDMRVSN